jgi:hypothetical protein
MKKLSDGQRNASVDKEPTPQERVAQWLLDDSAQRHAYQHEFSLAGFKTLVLINGGAIIALLTYIGNHASGHTATAFSCAFASYAAGLVLAMIAYLAAYFSQGSFLNVTGQRAWTLLGMESADKTTPETYAARGNLWIGAGVILCVLSLVAFVLGSWSAMNGLS